MLLASLAGAQEMRIDLTPKMVINVEDIGDPSGLVDEQRLTAGPPAGKPLNMWKINTVHNKDYPFSACLDLGEEKNLSNLWIFDTHSEGDLVISAGSPDNWTELTTYDCHAYMTWEKIPLDVTARYLRLTRMTPGAQFTEVAVYEYTPEAHKTMLVRKAAESKANAEREAALAHAMAEMKKRPLIDVGEPFGKLYLVDEIDCALQQPDHQFVEDPVGASEVQTILGRPCRVLKKTPDECAYFSYRIGKMKLLQPGAAYVLSVEYPEDASRSAVVMNAGNETSLGFHTGRSMGDAFHPKYVKNNNESLNAPLSGKYETWNTLFRLHDRFPDREFLRGDKERVLAPEDGFTVTISQFSAINIPASAGAAVARIRLFAVTEPETLHAKINLPPEGLPQRHLFWREEMADGVLGGEKNPKKGIVNAIDWYRFKAETMRFLGMNTYTKDLLEFGACQHWDSSDGGGNKWVYYNVEFKDLWGEIVELMGKEGFNILPYYEYSGSKGQQGLGNQRRCKPLTRDDTYTHIKWLEMANADVTDPDTYTDFKKMLDFTIIRHATKANFVGAWIRNRAQIPMSFADTTRERFAREANSGEAVTRQALIDDKALLAAYYDWWYGKRRDFLAAMCDHLRENGVDDAMLLYTAAGGEPGVSFPTWEPRMVTDDPAFWEPILAEEAHWERDQPIRRLSVDEVVGGDLYLEALLAMALNWGDWEPNHIAPPPDPQRYKTTDGVLMSHAFNRAYTVASPKTFDAFRGPAGVAVIRHYALNESMMFDKKDKEKLGYFVADFERAGPTCMLGEAWAMAHGDPWYIGYLVGGNYCRGFPKYVREFNANFLALPALPSRVLKGASSDPEVVVRVIETAEHGTYVAVVNTGLRAKDKVSITLPGKGQVHDAVLDRPFATPGGKLDLSLYPCQLRSFRIQ